MSLLLIRTIVLGILVVLLIQQARQAPAKSWKQRAFWLAAGALVLSALLNGLQIVGINTNPLFNPVLAISSILLAISAVFLYWAWSKGEMNDQLDRLREAIHHERDQRKKK